jgi:PAS domain S-box-containing protein
LGDGAIATDQDGRINRVNKVALDILGLTEKEVLGKWFPNTVISVNEMGEPVSSLERPITRAFITGKAVSEYTFFKTKTNPRLPVSVTVSPIMLNDKPIGAIKVFRDISKEHEVDRMKSEFISIASHQLRTPLSAINTYAQMLYSGYAGDLTEDQKSFMRVVLSSIERMNELINTLLDISRIESGTLRINPTALHYQDVITAIVREQKGAAYEKGILVSLKLPIEPLLVMADLLLLKEVCANLLSNAIKYTPPGGKITVTLRAKNENAILTIKDTGYGIPEESQRFLFTKFFRASNVLQKETVGTGLGLYMVKLISEGIGGKVWFKSKEGQGSTFYFSIPSKGM